MFIEPQEIMVQLGARSNVTFLSSPTQLGGDMGMVNVHLSAWLSIQGFQPSPMNFAILDKNMCY